MQMEFTGERYLPELLSAKISYEHWHRYMFASRFCTQKRVLDIACGEGFGSNFLSRYAESVVGVDIDPVVIEHAKRKYYRERLNFMISNATSVPVEPEEFDVIVSFETLEHLTKEDQHLFIEEMVRVLKEDGTLIISTPNKKVYSDDANYSNPFHLSEFYKEEFMAFLSGHFKNIAIFSQQVIGASLISRESESVYDIEHIHMRSGGFIPGIFSDEIEMEYMIGVCSQNNFSAAGSILLDDTNKLFDSNIKAP